jgi:hypothetical protein
MMRYFILEREDIRKKKEANAPKPWTKDPILQQFKFCNVRREDDKVTRWFATNWREPKNWREPNFIAAIMLGRTINWPDTLEEIGFPKVWSKEHVYGVLESRKIRGVKVYTGAYMVTQYGSSDPKNTLVTNNADEYFRARIPPQNTLEDMWEVLQTYPGMGPFMAAQVVADLKMTDVLREAEDWSSWAALGPGSTRGLNRLYDRPLNYGLRQDQGLEEMREVGEELGFHYLLDNLQDVQNCLCEFDKYLRVYTGQGLPRSRYDGYGE